jgi:hypothetical protein
MVANYTPGDAAAALPTDLHASGAAGTSPTATAQCPLGFYNDGSSAVFACVRCPGGAITKDTGSTSINDVSLVVLVSVTLLINRATAFPKSDNVLIFASWVACLAAAQLICRRHMPDISNI